METLYGYAGKMLYVNLTEEKFSSVDEDLEDMRKYLGGMCLGARILYDEVPPQAQWADPENRIIIAAGPLNGTKVMGSGTSCIVTIGALTEGTMVSQANGYSGVYLKFAGFDAVVIHGKARHPSYLYIHDGKAELRDARHLTGKDSWETEDLIKQELGFAPHAMSVLTIGPAGENLVRFAAVFGDRGHVAAHNGIGAVMGSKNLKAIAIARGKTKVKVHDGRKLSAIVKKTRELLKDSPVFHDGTLWITPRNITQGRAPILNYTTNVSPMNEEQFNTFTPKFLKTHLTLLKRSPCWGCTAHHCYIIRVPEGPYAGAEGEMPEYEGYVAMGTQLGIWDGIAVTALSVEVDRLGMDINETSWLLGMVIELYEKGILTKEDTDGLEMTWGNVDTVRTMIHKIAHRQGVGDMLAEGVMRAARSIGGEATECAIHTQSGTTPRSHDHRGIWTYIIDNCTSNTGSSEAQVVIDPEPLGIDAPSSKYAHKEIAAFVAKIKGHMPLIDSLVVCIMANAPTPDMLVGMLNAVTGWDFTWEEAMDVGRRAVNLLRATNNRRGYTPAVEAPSPRYGGKVTDGPNAGMHVVPVWDEMLDAYYEEMGWDRATGKPLPETLQKLGLADIIPDLWAQGNDR